MGGTDGRRTHRIAVRLTDGQRELLALRAEEEGRPMSGVISDALNRHLLGGVSGEDCFDVRMRRVTEQIRAMNERISGYSNMLLNFIPLFLRVHPEIREGFESTKEFREASRMLNDWFRHMVGDIHDYSPDFFEQIEHAVMVKGVKTGRERGDGRRHE